MGCVPSSPAAGRADMPAVAKASPAPLRPPAAKGAPSATSSPASPASSYETHLSASLVESNGSSVPFHGLLDHTHKLNITRVASPSSAPPPNKLRHRACHPLDDAVAARARAAAPDARLTVVTGVAMTLPYTVLVAAPDATPAVTRVVDAAFASAHAVLNGWNPASEISQFNRRAPEKRAALSPRLSALFDLVDTAFDMTDGRFDPTTGVLSTAFENCISERQRPPLPAEIAPFRHALGWRRRVARKGAGAMRLNAHTVVDLDGISKGFVVDVIVDALREQSFDAFYVDWAGDIRAVGAHPDGRPWRSAVIEPPQLSRVFDHWRNASINAMITEADIAYFANFVTPADGCADDAPANLGCAIAASGDYFSVQKYGFHHIANANAMAVMKAGSSSVGGVCVAASTCAIADAIATACMTFDSAKDAARFAEALRRSYDSVVYGYCVMGRDASAPTNPNDSTEVFTQGIFERCKSADEAVDSASSGTEELMPNAEQKDCQMLNKSVRVARRELFSLWAEVRMSGKTVLVDSLVSCSMDPLPVVTLIVPTAFADGVSEGDGMEGRGTEVECTAVWNRESPTVDKREGVTMYMRVDTVWRVAGMVMLIAHVENVDFGNVRTFMVTHGKLQVSDTLELPVQRPKVQFLSAIEKTRQALRHAAAMVWVVETAASGGAGRAITATSVNVVAEENRGNDCVVVFNVAHSSAFYAELGTKGVVVTLHAMSQGVESLARKFVRQCEATGGDLWRLADGALVSFECTVVDRRDVQDHLVVVGRVRVVRGGDGDESDGPRPLVWLKGGFVTW